ncbi:MAG TPA: Uma2 family endonuclease [Byssovorax sp.]|jgi:Uma2 family endonuclease
MGEKKAATYQDVLDAPEHVVAEILDDELFLSPRPASPANRVATAIGHELMGPFDRGRGGPGGWIIIIEPEVHLQGQIVVPDIAGWRRETMAVVPDEAFLSISPDWVCEVLSPSTEKLDRTRKMRAYAAFGVSHVWLVHPRRRMLEVYRRQERDWLSLGTFTEDDVVHAEPFEAIELDLSLFWKDTSPPTRASEGGLEYDSP